MLLDRAFDELLPKNLERSIVLDANSKPQLKNGAANFNVSHCKGYSACVVSREFEVGVDVENEDSRIFGVAKKLVLSDEERLFSELSDYERLKILTLRWTQYESYFKLTGEGIRRFFSTLPRLERQDNGCYKLIDRKKEAYIQAFKLKDGVLSVAAFSPFNLKIVDENKVIEGRL